MIELAPKKLCSGCAACRAVCPKDAILMVADEEGFLCPTIDPARCVLCGKCRSVCPVLVRGDMREPQSVYALMANDEDLRRASSSGGAFSLFAREILRKNGVVFCAAWDYETLSVKMVAARNEDELSALRGSKYVQADVGDVYRQVMRELKEGHPVLFSGAPCQVAALNRVVGDAKGLLLTVEVVCHGTPSPLAFRKYAEQREREVGKKILCPQDKDTFLRGFLSELYSRWSCHACSVRELRSGADLTIADYWEVDQKFPDMDDNKGTSQVLVNTERGRAAFDAIRLFCRVCESDYADVKRVNASVCCSVRPHRNRVRFFEEIKSVDDFDNAVMRLLRPTVAMRIRHLIGMALRKLHLRG